MKRKNVIYHVTGFTKFTISLFYVVVILLFSACAKPNIVYVVLVHSNKLADDKLEDLLEENNLSSKSVQISGAEFKVAGVYFYVGSRVRVEENMKDERVRVYVKKFIVTKDVYDFTKEVHNACNLHELYVLVNKVRLAINKGDTFYKLLEGGVADFLFNFNDSGFDSLKRDFIGELGVAVCQKFV